AFFLLMPPPPPSATLFPYTTLFRSTDPVLMVQASRDGGFTWDHERWISMGEIGEYRTLLRLHRWGAGRKWCWRIRCSAAVNVVRSEEHTSELQSRENLVCRLLLEKK